ncbi:MAG: hypothetical protein JNJ54_34700 [Myxococcaceae bacterium]|nr:hypothetical protein [Myxococcaceae bacterium]
MWATTLLIVCGTVMPFGGWLLAAINWWGLGTRVHLALPALAAMGRLAAPALVAVLAPKGLQFIEAMVLTFALNFTSMVLATLGMPARVKAQRAPGRPLGQSRPRHRRHAGPGLLLPRALQDLPLTWWRRR